MYDPILRAYVLSQELSKMGLEVRAGQAVDVGILKYMFESLENV